MNSIALQKKILSILLKKFFPKTFPKMNLFLPDSRPENIGFISRKIMPLLMRFKFVKRLSDAGIPVIIT